MTADPAAAFGAVFAALFVAHHVGDHWIQTDHQAQHKGRSPAEAPRSVRVRSWVALMGHVVSYTVTAAVMLALVVWRTGLVLDVSQVLVALLVSAVSHGWADRRRPLARLADWMGKSRFHNQASDGLNGAYLLDQSWHIGWLGIAALIAV